MSDKYYVAGCVDNGLSAEVVEDEHAEFWTLCERDTEGLSEAIIDCASRKEAETAMAVYVERDRLNEQVENLLTRLQIVRELNEVAGALHAEAEIQVRALAAENALMRDGVNRIAIAYTQEVPASFEIDRVRCGIDTPATDAALREVGARAVDGAAMGFHEKAFVAFENSNETGPLIRADLQEYAARIRTGEVQP